MKRTLKTTAIILALTATVAQAETIADQVITQLTEEGYERIEIKNGQQEVKVEAIRGTQKLEIIYDAVTGEVLKQEVSVVGEASPSDDDASDDDSDDNHEDDKTSDDDDDDDDHVSGSDDDNDDEAGDDSIDDDSDSDDAEDDGNDDEAEDDSNDDDSDGHDDKDDDSEDDN